jgi:protein-disulfide isomerase
VTLKETQMLRIKLTLALALAALSVAGCAPKTAAIASTADDMSLGNPKAKVTVVEYASVGCPVCARWSQEVYPAFKAKYIDPGKVNFVYREMLVGGGEEVAVAASGFLLARCAGPDKYFTVLDAIYKQQEQAFAAPRETLQGIGHTVGVNDAAFDKCVNDEKAILALNTRVEKHVTQDKIDSTPTFVINGKTLTPGYHPLEDLDAAITAAGG